MDRDQSYIDVSHTGPDFARHDFDLCQVKHDGVWARVTVRAGVATLTGRTGAALGALRVPGVPDCILIGEYMRIGLVMVFDCIEYDGPWCGAVGNIDDLPYRDRYRLVARLVGQEAGAELCLVQSHPIGKAADLWQRLVVDAAAEGLIYRRSGDAYAGAVIGREKALATVDAVAARDEDGSPVWALGEGVRQVIRDGVPLDEFIPGRVAEFAVLGRFKSGKLRNPCFLRWRDDK